MKAKIKLDEIIPIAEKFVRLIERSCDKVEIVGSIRRMKDYCGDIEILAIPKIRTVKKKTPLGNVLKVKSKVTKEYNLLIRQLQKMFENREIYIVKGKDKYFQLVIKDMVQVDLFLANKENWGLIKMIRTGSAAYTKNFMIASADTPYESKEGYLMYRKTGEIIPVESEEKLYNIMNFKLDHPRERTSKITVIKK